MNLSCKACVFWVPRVTKGSGKPPSVGECRRLPPTLMNGFIMTPRSQLDTTPTPRFPSATGFPQTKGQQWCGEYVKAGG